jgi:hypothetical protein
MTKWILLLRVAGTSVLLWNIIGGLIQAATSRFAFDVYYRGQVFIETAALALLCFGAAQALKTLQQIDQRTARQNAALRRLLPNTTRPSANIPTPYNLNAASYANQRTQRLDLAPTAPHWKDILPRDAPPPRDEGYKQRLARRAREVPPEPPTQARPVPQPFYIREVDEP